MPSDLIEHSFIFIQMFLVELYHKKLNKRTSPLVIMEENVAPSSFAEKFIYFYVFSVLDCRHPYAESVPRTCTLLVYTGIKYA